MAKKTIGQHAVEYMNKNGFTVLCFGDVGPLHEIAERCGCNDFPKGGVPHPMNRTGKVLAGMERDKRFEKKYLKHIGRPGRAYRLKIEHRGKG